MSALVVDTSTWIDYFSNGHEAEIIEDGLVAGQVHLPPIVAAELTSGLLSKKELEDLTSMLSDLPVCPTPLEHWLRVGKLRRELRRAGEAISTPDAHVAQCALDLEAILLSEDGVFQRVAEVLDLKIRE